MTDQPNTETDAERALERLMIAYHDARSGYMVDGKTALVELDYKTLKSSIARAVAPAPAGDVEQRVSVPKVAVELLLRAWEYSPAWCVGDFKYGRDALRAALAAMPSGRQLGLLEAATSDEALDAAAAKFAELNDAGLYRDQWKAVISAAIRTAAAQLGEPDDGWQDLEKLRRQGWSVAVHNDYRLNGEAKTFWLLTHPDGRWVKGEGITDAQALAQISTALLPAPLVPR